MHAKYLILCGGASKSSNATLLKFHLKHVHPPSPKQAWTTQIFFGTQSAALSELDAWTPQKNPVTLCRATLMWHEDWQPQLLYSPSLLPLRNTRHVANEMRLGLEPVRHGSHSCVRLSRTCVRLSRTCGRVLFFWAVGCGVILAAATFGLAAGTLGCCGFSSLSSSSEV